MAEIKNLLPGTEETTVSQEPTETVHHKKKLWIVLGGLTFCGVILVGILFASSTSPVGLTKATIKQKLLSTPSPTPFPLHELTIPYLRERHTKVNLDH